MEIAWGKEITKSAILIWFEQCESIIDKFDILTENIYNMDETGFSIGVINNIHIVVNNEELSHAIMHPGQQK